MITSQPIKIKSKKGFNFSTDIDQEPGNYVVEVVNLDGQAGAIWHQVSSPKAKDAIIDVFTYLADKLKKHDDAIDVVDNDCNTPFVSATEQKEILSALGQNPSVLVNGAPA